MHDKENKNSKESANVCFDRVHPKGWTVCSLVACVHAWRSFLVEDRHQPRNLSPVTAEETKLVRLLFPPPRRDATNEEPASWSWIGDLAILDAASLPPLPPPILCIHLFHQAVRERSQSDGSFQLLCCQRTIRSGITLHRKRN